MDSLLLGNPPARLLQVLIHRKGKVTQWVWKQASLHVLNEALKHLWRDRRVLRENKDGIHQGRLHLSVEPPSQGWAAAGIFRMHHSPGIRGRMEDKSTRKGQGLESLDPKKKKKKSTKWPLITPGNNLLIPSPHGAFPLNDFISLFLLITSLLFRSSFCSLRPRGLHR